MPSAENPAFGPVGNFKPLIDTRNPCSKCGLLACECDRPVPPLIHANDTRLGRAYDFLIGNILLRINPNVENGHGLDYDDCIDTILILNATSAWPDLPNRKRLLELVEATKREARE